MYSVKKFVKIVCKIFSKSEIVYNIPKLKIFYLIT